MNPVRRAAWLRIALVVLGLICAVGFYPLTVLWPAGWVWHQGHSDYLEMIIALYATLGVFLLLAARDPVRYLSLISFALWSSAVHGAVMAVQALRNPLHAGHLAGDVPALLIAALVLGWLCPEAARLPFEGGRG
ncbi:DUF6632 domain-containing protein [Derxia gummosa]|uniref:DUF6632 domain-containing protein n=1 Tax=Derxia gummosa DSM 723 TaxID=1121388 RepID=A0A8B6X7F3_9BURK|nr:DUF6632 domain-containing protein [Derxia gummosa]